MQSFVRAWVRHKDEIVHQFARVMKLMSEQDEQEVYMAPLRKVCQCNHFYLSLIADLLNYMEIFEMVSYSRGNVLSISTQTHLTKFCL